MSVPISSYTSTLMNVAKMYSGKDKGLLSLTELSIVDKLEELGLLQKTKSDDRWVGAFVPATAEDEFHYLSIRIAKELAGKPVSSLTNAQVTLALILEQLGYIVKPTDENTEIVVIGEFNPDKESF